MRSATAPAYRLFARSDLLMALFGSAVMAVAGAGLANWFGTGAGGVAYADSYASTPAAGAR